MAKKTKVNKIEATAGNAATAFDVVAEVPQRRYLLVINDTAQICYLRIGGDELSDPAKDASATDHSKALAAGEVYLATGEEAAYSLQALFAAEDAGEFLRVTEGY